MLASWRAAQLLNSICLVELLLVGDGEAGVFERGAPFLHGPGAQVAGIAEAFEGIDVIADAARRHHIVDQGEQAARLEHAVHLGEEFRDRIRSDAARCGR